KVILCCSVLAPLSFGELVPTIREGLGVRSDKEILFTNLSLAHYTCTQYYKSTGRTINSSIAALLIIFTSRYMETSFGHLTYCTNIHAGESWKDHFEALKKFFPSIKEKISPGNAMGIGLRLSNEASIDLLHEENLGDFKKWLHKEGAYVFTMNGFPYGGFHRTSVKDNVHTPDWTTRERVAYTIRLFDILKALLPEGMDGGISTSPLGYRRRFSPGELKAKRETATNNILDVVEYLIQQSAQGKTMHLDIEPEPDGILETGDEFIEWFEGELMQAGIKRLMQKFDAGNDKAIALLKKHLCLCYDVCHFAVGYEDHEKEINRLEEKGIRVGKIQISAALKKEMGSDSEERKNIKEAFEKFNEPVYLHQVVAKKDNGGLLRYPDLPEALDDYNNKSVVEWRAHFHVPIAADDFGLLQSTRSDIIQVLNIQKQKRFTHHLEAETYTWEVLPQELKLPLQESIIRELDWVKQVLS
ncbi:metabolite traffic protein EboE, partial [Parafilimonas sp.]|uniref:metabolite traffic protein EboE n=1 Tax=Parafilimonas sp. TaxID=1969739 RepID=UPI0039E4147C